MSAAEQYASWVLDPSNALRTGEYIKLAAKRFLSDLKREDIYFDENEGNRMVVFGERFCCLWEDKWRGKPVEIKPWMAFVFQQIHGWFRKSDGLRRVRKVYVQVAKKNAKTTLAGVLANFHLFTDLRIQTPKIFVGAQNEEQAKICVNITGKIIEQSPALYELVESETVKLFNYKENIINIVHTERDGFIKALSKETGDKSSKTAGGKHGINPSMGIIDEYAMAADDNLLNTLESAQAAREEPLIFCITTAGFNMDGPCYQKLRKSGIGVLEGTMEDDSYLPFIFELDQGDDIYNEALWEKCNPNIDVSVSRQFLRSRLVAAKNEGGSKEVDVKTLNFNMWVDSPEVFVSTEIWNTNTHGLTIEEGETCYGGLEVGPSGEISALALLFPGEITKIKMLFWIAEEALKFNDFYRDNKEIIKVDPGNEVENEVAISWIEQEFQKYNMHSFCFPNTQKNNSIVQGLIKLGYEGNPISQGMSGIAAPTDQWEKLLRAGQIEHFGNPILRMHNSNCLAIKKESGTRIEKNGKVLGIYACLNAVAQWQTIAAGPSSEIGILYI